MLNLSVNQRHGSGGQSAVWRLAAQHPCVLYLARHTAEERGGIDSGWMYPDLGHRAGRLFLLGSGGAGEPLPGL